MSEKHLVCNGAVCQCKFGTAPDKLKVKQKDYYINEDEASKKAIANTKELDSLLKQILLEVVKK
ncbi:hypothetical protein [Pedobacter sp. NJ-S-72]